jgi:hypothetical protein
MPKLHSTAVKHRMAELRVTSEMLAETTGIPWGALRNALAGRDPLRLERIYDVGRVLSRKGERLRAVVADLLGTHEDGVPDPPPDQTKSKPKPERRKERGGTGPKRDQSVRGVA